MVNEMERWEDGIWRWKIEWRRELREKEREGEGEMYDFLRGFSIKEGVKESWRWGRKNGDFTVKEAYERVVRGDTDRANN